MLYLIMVKTNMTNRKAVLVSIDVEQYDWMREMDINISAFVRHQIRDRKGNDKNGTRSNNKF